MSARDGRGVGVLIVTGILENYLVSLSALLVVVFLIAYLFTRDALLLDFVWAFVGAFGGQSVNGAARAAEA